MANFEYSEEKKRKDAALAQHNATKPGAFSYSGATAMDNLANQLQDYKKFSYDINADALYQQYKDQYIQQGKLASMDTMGQAAAMTGGYGNSYAQNVGQQAYQGYLQQLNNKIPELYQLALNQYTQDKKDLYNQYALHQDKEKQEYSQYLNELNNWITERDYLAKDVANTAQTEYNQWLDSRKMEENEKANVIDLMISKGYVPTDEELDKLGITSKQAQSYNNAYVNNTNAKAATQKTREKTASESEIQNVEDKIANCKTADDLEKLSIRLMEEGWGKAWLRPLLEDRDQEIQANEAKKLNRSPGQVGLWF